MASRMNCRYRAPVPFTLSSLPYYPMDWLPMLTKKDVMAITKKRITGCNLARSDRLRSAADNARELLGFVYPRLKAADRQHYQRGLTTRSRMSLTCTALHAPCSIFSTAAGDDTDAHMVWRKGHDQPRLRDGNLLPRDFAMIARTMTQSRRRGIDMENIDTLRHRAEQLRLGLEIVMGATTRLCGTDTADAARAAPETHRLRRCRCVACSSRW